MDRTKNSLTLLIDLYQLTMAYGYWKTGIHEQEAVFNLFFRGSPFGGQYAICAGLATAIDFLTAFQFYADDIAYLKTLTTEIGQPLFDKAFLDYLGQLKFNCSVAAMAEGEVVFAHEPILRITGPLLVCQLLETPLVNILNFQTLIATKASRVCHAADGQPVFEFGLRRAQGIDGGLSASRAAYLGGCIATSNTLAGKLYNIPVQGTHAHSWVMAFPTEKAAFQAYATVFPDNCIFLVDTYNTLNGTKNAIEVGQWLKQQGKTIKGIRLDSGDLAKLSKEGRKLLDAAGFTKAIIVASGDLDEYLIADLKAKGAAIDVWGVGTRLVTAYDQPALNMVYKLAALRQNDGTWQPKIKLSENLSKASVPGLLKVRRYFIKDQPIADVIYDEELGIKKGFKFTDIKNKTEHEILADFTYIDLLQPIFQRGKCVYSIPSLSQSRQKVMMQLKQFPKPYPVGYEPSFQTFKTNLFQRTKVNNQ